MTDSSSQNPGALPDARPDALVIGASGVLGHAIASRLASESGGHGVLATYFSRPENVLSLRQRGCLIERLDVRDEAAVESLLARARPRSVALCSGASGSGLVARMSARAWSEALDVHLNALFWGLRAALKYLPDGSRVVWLGSRVGEVGGAGQSAYAACKAAGEALVQSAAREGAPRGLAFNTVCPGFVPSPLTLGLSQERLRQERERDAGGQLGRPEACAEMVAWLLSPASTGVSGQVLHADARLR